MKLLSLLLFGFALACSNNSSGPGIVRETAVSDYEYGETEESFTLSETSDGFKVTAVIQEQKIIKTALLAFETKNIAATHKSILDLAIQNKGFVQNDNSGKSYNRIYRNMVIRIPSEKFQVFIDDISKGVSYFDQKDISRQDVSEEFVDLEARLKAKRELENRYLELLKQAKNVKEMLEIERELSKIREEIEAKQGRLQFLQNRVSMSTVNLEFYTLTSETGITQSYGQKMINSLKAGWDGISMFFLGILSLWPLFLIVLLVIFVIKRLFKRNKKKSL